MGAERAPTEHASQSAETTWIAIQLLAAASASCGELGIQASIGVHGLPRDVFDRLEDYGSNQDPGIQISPDKENPLWWKRSPGRINIYTQEPPALETSPHCGESSAGRHHPAGES